MTNTLRRGQTGWKTGSAGLAGGEGVLETYVEAPGQARRTRITTRMVRASIEK